MRCACGYASIAWLLGPWSFLDGRRDGPARLALDSDGMCRHEEPTSGHGADQTTEVPSFVRRDAACAYSVLLGLLIHQYHAGSRHSARLDTIPSRLVPRLQLLSTLPHMQGRQNLLYMKMPSTTT